jgi:hypothetical protein
MGEPARGYSWPPFTEGNRAATKHGVWNSERTEAVAREVDALAAVLASQFPWTAAYEAERRAYARALLDEECIRSYLDTVGMLDEQGHERPAVRTLERFAGRAARCRHALGLSPMAAAKLLSLLSDVVRAHPDQPLADLGLDALLAQGRAALDRGTGAEPE